MEQSINKNLVLPRKNSALFIENLKNRAMVKLKVKESFEIFPKDDPYPKLLHETPNYQQFDPVSNSTPAYQTEKILDKNNLLFQDISEFIKNEKRNYKLSKRKVSLFEDNKYNTNKRSSLTSDFTNKNLNNETKNNKKVRMNMKDYYKSYIEELETHIEQLLQRNDELETKIENVNKLEIENEKLEIEALKYKKLKKVANVFSKKKKLENNCDNPLCMSNLISLMDITKEYDKLLLENIKLKKENCELKEKVLKK